MAKSAASKKLAVVNEAPETYMEDCHIAEFRQVLERMMRECNDGIRQAMESLLGEDERTSDAADSCDIHIFREQRQATIKRLKQKVVEIEAALRRLESGDYGYCEETGDEIGLARLRANPLARLSIEAANRSEHMNKLRAK